MKHRFPALYFEATRLCNLSCPICMTSSNDDECVRESRGRELSYEEIRDLVLVPAKRIGTVAVGWSGGEFLLRQDAFDLLRLTAELGYRCNVCSNCEILDRELLQEMKQAAGKDARRCPQIKAMRPLCPVCHLRSADEQR